MSAYRSDLAAAHARIAALEMALAASNQARREAEQELARLHQQVAEDAEAALRQREQLHNILATITRAREVKPIPTFSMHELGVSRLGVYGLVLVGVALTIWGLHTFGGNAIGLELKVALGFAGVIGVAGEHVRTLVARARRLERIRGASFASETGRTSGTRGQMSEGQQD